MTEATTTAPVETIIHLRFNLDGTVGEIGERPPGVQAQTWFKFLTQNTQESFQALSGGRGLFRLPKPQIEALKAACSAEQAS